MRFFAAPRLRMTDREGYEYGLGMTCTKAFLLPLLLFFFLLETPRAEEGEDALLPTLPEVVVVGEPQEKTQYVEDTASTATKTDAPIDAVPQSIQVINRDVIDDQRAERLQDVIYNVAGAVPGDAILMPFSLRGLRAEILQDGFANTRAFPLQILHEELTNVERVEFLKGPASVLYGNAASGGILNIISKEPLPYFFASAEMTTGSFDFYRPAVDITGPLNREKTLLFRLNASYQDSDNFRDFVTSERLFIGPSVRWNMLPHMTLTLAGEYFDVDQPFDFGVVAFGDGIADVPFSRNFSGPTAQDSFARGSLTTTLETTFNEHLSLRNTFRYYRTDHRTFSFIPAGPPDRDGILPRLISDAPDAHSARIYTTQHELTMQGRTGPVEHRSLLGIELAREDHTTITVLRPANPINIFQPEYGKVEILAPVVAARRISELDSLALYAQDHLQVFKRLHVLAGFRFDHFVQGVKETGTSTTPGTLVFDKVDNQLSPRLGAVYALLPGVSLYTSYGQSFNLLLNTAVSAESAVFDPESSSQYEGGVKLSLWDGQVSSTLAVFHMIREDTAIQETLFSARQIAEERSRGVELDLAAEPVRGWNLIASYAYIDAEVREDKVFPQGNRLAGIPKHSGSFWTTYRFSQGLLAGLSIGAGIIAVSERKGDLENSFHLGDFVRLDMALFYEREIRKIGKVKASLNFKNVTDTDYIQNSLVRAYVIPGEPFMVLGNLRLEF